MPDPSSGSLLDQVAAGAQAEELKTLVSRPGLKIERIVSTGQSSPPGFWYDQSWDEWVLLVSGSAAIEFESAGPPHILKPGDYVYIPARRRHRVSRTSAQQPTIWLAVHFGDIPADDVLG